MSSEPPSSCSSATTRTTAPALVRTSLKEPIGGRGDSSDGVTPEEEKNKTPCPAVPGGYRTFAVEVNPSTRKTADISKCAICGARFTWLNHRHKCKKCLAPVCHWCSKSQKVLRAHHAPKRVCDVCVEDMRPMTTPAAPVANSDQGTVSTQASAYDPNAHPIDNMTTASVLPGTPAAAGVYGANAVACSGTSAAAAAEPAGERAAPAAATVAVAAVLATVDDGCSLSAGSSHGRNHHKVGAAMPLLRPASPPPPLSSMHMLLPTTPIGRIEHEEGGEDVMPPVPGGSVDAVDGAASSSPPSQDEKEEDEEDRQVHAPALSSVGGEGEEEREKEGGDIHAGALALSSSGGEEKVDEEDQDVDAPALSYPGVEEQKEMEEEDEEVNAPALSSSGGEEKGEEEEEEHEGHGEQQEEIGDQSRLQGARQQEQQQQQEQHQEEEGKGKLDVPFLSSPGTRAEEEEQKDDLKTGLKLPGWTSAAMVGIAIGAGVAVGVLAVRVFGRARK